MRIINGLILSATLACYVVCLILIFSISSMEKKISSLEQSVTTLQRFTIQQDQLIMNNMLTLYRAIDAPVKDISLIELAIEEKQKLWSVIK